MNIRNSQGQIDWKNNTYLLYVLYATMKYFMERDGLIDIPCQESDPRVKDCSAVLGLILNENITPGQVGSQLWLHGDRGSFSGASYRNLEIAMKVGLINESNFTTVLLETRARMERNKLESK
jgi:hypothetical protein